MTRLALALAAALIGLVPRGTLADSTIDTTLPVQGKAYNAAPIRDNFGAAANDITALQHMNAGASAPASPILGTLWLQTPLSGTTYTLKVWDSISHGWVVIAALESTTGLWVPPVGGGTLPSIVSAATTNLGSVPQAALYITGSQSIASFGSSTPAGQVKFLTFTGSPTVLYNPTAMILPTGANISFAPGQSIIAVSLGSGNWRIGYASGATCGIATASAVGCVKPDGTTISISGAGTITAVAGASGINQLTGDVAAGPGVGSQVATLATVATPGTNLKITYNDKGLVTSGTTAACADLSDDGAGCTAGAATPSTAGIVKLHNVPQAVGWPAALDPNNIVLTGINQDSTISAIIGYVETPVGAAATVTVKKASSGTACSAGTALHSGTFNANGTAATNQTLTVTTASLAAGDRICLQTTGGANWTGGVGIGTVVVFLAPS